MQFKMEPIRSESLSLQEIERTAEYRNSLTLLQESGFLPFLQNFNGFDMAVVLEFTRTFKEGQVRVGSLEFKVTEESIAQATDLPLIGEHWFKNEQLAKKQWHWFVFEKKIKVDWRKGLHRVPWLGSGETYCLYCRNS